MFSICDNARIFLYGSPVNLQNGFDGLSYLAHSSFKNEMIPDTYFVFINPRRTRMKMLYWNGNNLIIFYLRLRKGTFFPLSSRLRFSRITTRDLNLIISRQVPKHLFCL